MAENRRQLYDRMLRDMELERQSFIDHWRDLSDFGQPRRGRWLVDDRNKGNRRDRAIINNVTMRAVRTATAGFLTGMMSPTQPWLAYTVPDPDLMKAVRVKAWLYSVSALALDIMARSNLYNVAPATLTELIQFGSACMQHTDSFDDVARFYNWTIGSFVIAQNDEQIVDTVGRRYEMQTKPLIKKFGLDNVSKAVRDQFDKGNYGDWWEVGHLYMPNDQYAVDHAFAKHSGPYSSCYWEVKTDPGKDGFLLESSTQEFELMVPRWETTGEDIYGTNCPGMMALGDTKGLQVKARRAAQGLDKMVSPPMTGPASAKNVRLQNKPGGFIAYDGGDNQNQVRSAYNVNIPISEIRQDMDVDEKRIEQAYFVDLFRSIASIEGVQPQNQLYLNSRKQEDLQALGPVLESVHKDMLERLVLKLFNQMMRAKLLPPPPPELQGQAIRVRFLSPLAMAQRSGVASALERWTYFMGGMQGMGVQGVLDNMDADAVATLYADTTGVPPSVIADQEAVAQIRQARALQQQQQQQMEQAQAASQATQNLANAKTSEPSALTALAQGAAANPGLVQQQIGAQAARGQAKSALQQFTGVPGAAGR